MNLYLDITRWSILKSVIMFFAAEDGETNVVSKNKTWS